jgi:hypothetical protein
VWKPLFHKTLDDGRADFRVLQGVDTWWNTSHRAVTALPLVLVLIVGVAVGVVAVGVVTVVVVPA